MCVILRRVDGDFIDPLELNAASHLGTPGLPVEMLFKQVRLAVARETGRVQVPWESSSLTGDFCFRLGPQGNCSIAR